MPPKAVMSWSTGKDSAHALRRIYQQGAWEVTGLLSTLNAEFQRVSMHGVREQLLDEQAKMLNLPLLKVPMPWPCSNQCYEDAMGKAFATLKAQGITHVIFGDLFLQDIRRYRESLLARAGLQGSVSAVGPCATRALADEMLHSGLKATLSCINPKQLPHHFAGRVFDQALLQELPEHVDACGENGEFHTFVHESPLFKRLIALQVGQIVQRDGFVFADLLPARHDTP